MSTIEERWAELKRDVDTCTRCPLYANTTQAVLGDGNRSAHLMITAEAPGKDEDRDGIPFTGKAGKELDKALATFGITREHIYLANVMKHRPYEISEYGNEKNRSPLPDEIAACTPYLDRQVELVAPAFILCLGAPAAKHVIRSAFYITRERGIVFDSKYTINGRRVKAMATMHPAWILRKHGAEYEEAYATLVQDIQTARDATRQALKEAK